MSRSTTGTGPGRWIARRRDAGRAARRAVAAALLAGVVLASAGCSTPSPTAPPSAAPTVSSTRQPVASPTPTLLPTVRPSPPVGTVPVDIPEAGVLIPVPAGWIQIPAADLSDPARRADLAAKYPGSDALLAQADRLNGQAAPVLLAVDPTAAERSDPLAANLSVLVTQPSVSGPLLDLAAGFIADGMAESLGATETATKEHVQLAVGEAVRIGLTLPPRDGHPMSATAWVVAAPGATMLVTLLGPVSALGDLDPDALVAAMIRDAGDAQ